MVPFWARCTAHFRTYFSGDWDVHWGSIGILTHGRRLEPRNWFPFWGNQPSLGLSSHFGVVKHVEPCPRKPVGQNQWYLFGLGAPPILEPILVGIGMFTGGTIGILTHGQADLNPGIGFPFGEINHPWVQVATLVLSHMLNPVPENLWAKTNGTFLG